MYLITVSWALMNKQGVSSNGSLKRDDNTDSVTLQAQELQSSFCLVHQSAQRSQGEHSLN